jgi:hypothetical protein
MENAGDTVTVSFVGNGTLGDSVTAGTQGQVQARLIYLDTTTASRTQVGTTANGTYTAANKLESRTAAPQLYAVNSATIGAVGANFAIQLDSGTTQIAGTYSFTVFVRQFTQGTTNPVITTYPVSIVSAALPSASVTASSSTSTSLLYGAGTWVANGTAVDSTVAVPGAAAAAPVAVVKVDLKNAAGGQASVLDSLTVSIDKGNVSVDDATPGTAATGKTLAAVSYTGTTKYIHVYGDGSTGVATLTIATKNAGTFTEKISFYGVSASAKATVVSAVIGATGTGVILGSEADSLSNDLGTATSLFAYSSDTSVISNFGTACGSYDLTLGGVLCNLTGVKSGTANITLRDASTVALSTVAAPAVAVRVSIGEIATSATITFNKSSYAPGEKVTAIVKVLDAKGLTMPAGTYANVFAAGGITTSSQLTWAAGESLTATSVTTAGNTTSSATAPVVSTEPIAQFTYFLPTTGGNVVFTTKGGTGLALAGQVAITATATVVDSGAAALAAVTALATTVASLRTLIVTLTNLVLKIQKKVRA